MPSMELSQWSFFSSRIFNRLMVSNFLFTFFFLFLAKETQTYIKALPLKNGEVKKMSSEMEVTGSYAYSEIKQM